MGPEIWLIWIKQMQCVVLNYVRCNCTLLYSKYVLHLFYSTLLATFILYSNFYSSYCLSIVAHKWAGLQRRVGVHPGLVTSLVLHRETTHLHTFTTYRHFRGASRCYPHSFGLWEKNMQTPHRQTPLSNQQVKTQNLIPVRRLLHCSTTIFAINVKILTVFHM